MDTFDHTFKLMLKEKKPVSIKDAMDKAREMDKHVAPTGKEDLLNLASTSCSSHIRKEDKASRSMNVDPSPNPMQVIMSSMAHMMKQQMAMMQIMQDQINKPREYSRPSFKYQNQKLKNS